VGGHSHLSHTQEIVLLKILTRVSITMAAMQGAPSLRQAFADSHPRGGCVCGGGHANSSHRNPELSHAKHRDPCFCETFPSPGPPCRTPPACTRGPPAATQAPPSGRRPRPRVARCRCRRGSNSWPASASSSTNCRGPRCWGRRPRCRSLDPSRNPTSGLPSC